MAPLLSCRRVAAASAVLALAAALPAPAASLDSEAAFGARRAEQSSVFAVEDETFGQGSEVVHLKILRNVVTGELVEIATNLGGRTNALKLRGPNGQLKEVLMHSGRNATDASKHVGWKGDMLAPYANRIMNGTYRLNGETFYMRRNEDRSPYGKNSLHGYLWSKEMRVVHTSADDSAAEVTLTHSFNGQDPGYPFPLDMALTYRLDVDGFTVITRARNRDLKGKALPFYSSWHSYFLVQDISRAIIELDRCSRWNHILLNNNSNRFGDLIPNGATEPFSHFDGRTPIGGTLQAPTYYDDEFKAIAPSEACTRIETRIKDPVGGTTTVLWGDRQFRWIQVYTGTVKDCGVQAIAVEAMNGEADSWNNLEGIRLLQAGESWEGVFGVHLEQDPPSPLVAMSTAGAGANQSGTGERRPRGYV